MARKRYVDGRIVDFPQGSTWRETWDDIRDIAFLRRVTTGTVVLEALEEYVQRMRKEYPQLDGRTKKQRK
jgi:hypothetical protein